MSSSSLHTETVVRLLLQDVEPTLGARGRAEVLRLAEQYSALAEEWIHDGESTTVAQRSLERSVVDGVQQTAHDLFWDTTWPACPRHGRHPLWYDEDQRAWCCYQDGVAIAALGSLVPRQPAP